jgi:hypothetical protein
LFNDVSRFFIDGDINRLFSLHEPPDKKLQAKYALACTGLACNKVRLACWESTLKEGIKALDSGGYPLFTHKFGLLANFPALEKASRSSVDLSCLNCNRLRSRSQRIYALSEP